jgi:hypothetical protein
MERIQLGEWRPDQPGIAGNLTDVQNVVPQMVGYGGFPTTSVYSQAASEDLLSLYTGVYGNDLTMFAGSATKIFKFNELTDQLDNVSKTGGYTSTTWWDMVQFGNVMIAANDKDVLQSWNLTSSSAFANLSASAPIAKFVTVVRDFVVAANIGGGTNPTRVQWSDLNDETDWTPAATSQSDYQDMADGGNITGLTGGEFGLVLMERAVARMTYSGSPYFFQFDIISRNLGCMEPGSVAQYGNMTYFLSDNGFYACDGQNLMPIGAEKVDRFFQTDSNDSYLNEMSTAIDPIRKLVVWEYRNNDEEQALLIYNWQTQRWSYGITTADFLSSAATPALTLEALDAFGTVDSITTTFDSRLWVGEKNILAGIQGNQIVTFTGANAEAYLVTGDLEFSQNSVVTVIKPIVDNGDCNAQIASRRSLADAITFSATSIENADGRCNVRSAGRYHRIKLIPTGLWTTAVGMDVEIASQGNR